MTGRVGPGVVVAVGVPGAAVLALAFGMPAWLSALVDASARHFGLTAPARMHEGLPLISLGFALAFISPSLLVIVVPLPALIPIALLLVAMRRHRLRRAPVRYGGSSQDPVRSAIAALTFSNALRIFYSFVYRPTAEVTREIRAREYFVTRLVFTHEVAPVFSPSLFVPAISPARTAAGKLRPLQPGYLNSYLGPIGIMPVGILGLTFL